MIEALILCIAILGSIGGGGTAAVLCVHKIENSKVKQVEMTEGTKQEAFRTAYLTEENRKTELAIQSAHLELPPASAPELGKLSWDIS